MADYNLFGLNPRDFQHMVQAVARSVIASGVTALGDGKDGNRDLTFNGRMDYPSRSDQWNGYLILGAKFKQKNDEVEPVKWATRQLEIDLKKFTSRTWKRTKPEYYLFATNVALSPVPDVGGRAKVEALLGKYAPKIGLKAWGIWDYHDIRGFLDTHADIRTAYGNFITAGDVLNELIGRLNAERADLLDAMNLFIQKEFIADLSAKLQSAGDDPELQIPLGNVFVDLPFARTSSEAVEPSEEKKSDEIVDFLLWNAGFIHRRGVEDDRLDGSDRPVSRLVVIGGPGQGKSTVGQFLAQLYRASILSERPTETLDYKTTAGVQNLRESTLDGLPVAKRWPIRVELRNYSHALAGSPRLTLFNFIREDIERLSNLSVAARDLREWFKVMPLVIILDGLDEVPPSSNRAEVLKEIESFRVDLASLNADVFLLATTRPQSYSREFSEEAFRHLYLRPLSARQALRYGERLAHARCGGDQRREEELLRSLSKACANEATSRLMQSPLQVTIMTTLVEDTGEPPQQRYRLFAEYYRTIYKRETRRRLLGGILTERQKDIDVIHSTVGILLHAAAEVSQLQERTDSDSALSDEQFRKVVKRRLEDMKVKEPKSSELLAKITDESLQRLVFLVRPREGALCFDIASFKEFMAAEALMSGSDDVLRARLRFAGSASYWRNVFLFACGKCFVEREYLIDHLVALCTALDEEAAAAEIFSDPVAGQASRAILWGSRLALDVLNDGSARQNPGVEVVFVRRALQLVKFCDVELLARLGAAYHEDLDNLFREEIISALRVGDSDRQGALLLLIFLASREVAWAGKLFDDECTIREFRALANAHAHALRSAFFQGEVAKRLGDLEPDLVRRTLPYQSSDRAPSVLLALGRLWYRQDLEAFNNSKWQWAARSVEVVRVAATWDLRELDCVQLEQSWLPLISARRFQAAPSKSTLSAELKSLAESGLSIAYLRQQALPWPMAQCLSVVTSLEELQSLSEKVERGLLGDANDWLAAERRWEGAGITDADQLHIAADGLPFDKNIGAVGFPFAGARSKHQGEWPVQLNIAELKLFNPQAQRFYATSILYESYEDGWRPPTVAELDQLASFLVPGEPIWIDEYLDRFDENGFFSEAEYERLEWLGRAAECWVIRPEDKGPSGAAILERFCADPVGAPGLFEILRQLARDGVSLPITKSALLAVESWGDADKFISALAMRLCARDLSEREATQLSDRLLEAATQRQLITALAILRAGELRRAAHLALRAVVCDEYPTIAVRVLAAYLARKPSRFSDPSEWKNLGLPLWI